MRVRPARQRFPHRPEAGGTNGAFDRTRRRRLQPSVLALLLSLLAAVAGCDRAPTVVLQPKNGPATSVRVEIADTPDSQSLGLMYRTHLDLDRGMLFVFEHEGDHPFWMKNTAISLDMIFIASDGRVTAVHPNTTPFSLAPVGAGALSRTVLEVNAGFAAKHGIAAGDHVTYRRIASTKLP